MHPTMKQGIKIFIMYDFNKRLLEEVGEELKERKETIACAESVTSGLLQFAFSNITEASSFFNGGITAYNLAEKVKHLCVEPGHASEVNCVSQQVADEMALEVCRMFNCNWGIGITGYASPVPESDGKLFAYFSICYNNQIVYNDEIIPHGTSPVSVQWYYANTVIEQLSLVLQENEKPGMVPGLTH
jgi:competence/damage-inducible protein CinA C-terminal domain